MAQDAQQVMLAHSWTEDSGIDPAGYWMAEKLVKQAYPPSPHTAIFTPHHNTPVYRCN